MNKRPKPRPNKPFDGVSCTRYDNGYVRNKVIFTVSGEDLQIRFCAGFAPKRSAVDFFIKEYRQYSALEVIRDINDFHVTEGEKATGEWGRHFEDGILEIWNKLDLPFGWM